MPITTPKVPDGLPELMRGLAKSVIKENPENIYVHAAEYFENLIRERDGDLDKGYGSFSAYKVYSDYKDKCREKGGSGSPAPAKAVSDGDDDDSGGSASAKARGRRRKRVRKQGSKDSGKSMEKEDVPGSASSGGAGETLSSIKEDAQLTEKTVEEEPVKVETRKEVQTALSKAISIDSEAAANAVSTVLEDTVLDSDEADQAPEEEAEWENLKQPINCEDISSYPAEDFGSAPSTAEVAGEVAGDGENLVEDAPPSEETPEKTPDEVDLAEPSESSSPKKSASMEDQEKQESQNGEVEEPTVNGSAESPKKVSEDEPEEGIDTVDAEEDLAIEPRMGADDDVPDMPEVPTEEPDAEPEEVESKDAEENPTENGVGEEAQAENPENSTEQNADEEQNSRSESPKKSDDQESEAAKEIEEPQAEESPRSGSVEKSGSVEEPAAESEAKESSQEKEPEVTADDEQQPEDPGEVQQDDAVPSEASSPKKSASVDKENQKSDPSEGAVSPPKSASIEAAEEPTENQSPQQTDSIEAVEEPTENQEEAPSDDNQKSGSASPQKSASIEVASNPVEADAPPSNENDQPASESPKKSASVEQEDTPASPGKSVSVDDAPNESETAEQESEPPAEEEPSSDQAPAEESNSPKKSASIEAVSEEQPAQDDEEQQANEDEGASSSPKKSASMDETSKPASEDQGSAPLDEVVEPSGSSSPKKSASVEDEEKPEPETDDSPKEESLNEAEDNAKSDEGSPEKSGSVEDPPPDASASKESSLEKTETDPNAGDGDSEQSKETSAKESEGDATKQDASEEAGEMSIGSRMGAEDDEQQPDTEPSAPPSEAVEDGDNSEGKVGSGENEESKNDEGSGEGSKQNSVEDENSKEEAVEEPCIQRQVSPSTSKPPSKHQSTDLEEIKKVDLASFNKDSAEALFYSLKKTELQNEAEQPKKEDGEEDDDDADVVVGAEEEPPAPISRQLSKRSFTDDFLEKGPITEEAPKQAEGDGVQETGEDGGDEQFNPIMAATVRNQQLQEQMHARDDTELVGLKERKTPIRRSMTERVDLVRQDSNYVDLRKYDPDYVQEEDDFDGYYIGNIKNKILASSVSVADSDDFDPRQSQEVIDDNNVKTALETIASTDTESTLPSQITVQTNRGFLKNTASNIPYASFGNNAIDQSLDEFIEREEQNKEAEEQAAASKIQRSYRQFRSNKKKLLRDYHSTMQTCTEDQSTESLEECPNSIIKIKVDQKQPEGAQQGEESENNSIEDGRAENRRRPMYSLNIDEYDTAARRMMLTRGVAMQRTSTPEEDSGKSDNTSGDKKPQASSEPETKVAEGSTISTSGPSSTEDKKEGGSSSSDEKENKDTGSSKSNEGSTTGKARPLSDSRKHVSLDAQKLFLARQRTMPVQIDASVIRVLPKHMRKRNKSAGMVRK